MYRTGIDIGSTTCKLVITDRNNTPVFTRYGRHNTDVYNSLVHFLKEAEKKLGNISIAPVITGSVGMGVSEKLNIPFIQEVIAASGVVSSLYTGSSLLIDIGGEDSKLLFFKKNGQPDIRMNGNCAGGTGAFIDQMAILLNLSLPELDELALKGGKIYPMASRCGVFAKTDLQNLVSKQVPVEDIAMSVFNAVAVQTSTTLMQGLEVKPPAIFSGGPLVFMKGMQKAMANVLELSQDDIIIPEHAGVFSALGAALSDDIERKEVCISEFIAAITSIKEQKLSVRENSLKPLFINKEEFTGWDKKKHDNIIFKDIATGKDPGNIYIGIDAGSTTTKLVVIDDKKKIIFSRYLKNSGNTVNAVRESLKGLEKFIKEKQLKTSIRYSVVTGYGEELVKKAFGIDKGIVETIAHYKAAAHFKPGVSFILDIGGQDIKAVYLKDGHITNIEINEACSSGCGTFIETFAGSLGITVQEFAEKACSSKEPYDLGSRCTVFMNSKLKQAMREGAGVDDISAGLAYSVIKNCFVKALKISDAGQLGDEIVVQGGTFLNPAVLRACELFLGKEVYRPEISELMGAYGCALTAIEQAEKTNAGETSFIGFEQLENTRISNTNAITCKGCGNNCTVNEISFSGGENFYTGNRCEKIYSNSGEELYKADNLYAYKYKLLFGKKRTVSEPLFRLGIPRVLNIYDNFPFWSVLFSELNIEVCLSSPSENIEKQKAYASVMSDNICYPAKLVHAHIHDLMAKKVDRIFYPLVKYENNEFKDAVNSYNCPVVTGYPDVISSTVNPAGAGIPFDMPAIVFNNKKLLEKSCFSYLEQFGIGKKDFRRAFESAIKNKTEFRNELVNKGQEILRNAKKDNRQVILLAGRPYHADPAVNHNIPAIISDMGLDVILEDAIPADESFRFNGDVHVISQWQYSNRIYNAFEWAGKQENVQVIQLNSFGCGPDAVVMDEAKAIMEKYNKYYTLIRIDEGENRASIKLRIRSMVETLKYNRNNETGSVMPVRKELPSFLDIDRNKLIIGPNLSQKYALFTESIFFQEGYNFELLPEADRKSVETGMKYVNNDICYPAIILIGDIIKALQSGKYDPDNVVVAMSETGGQCRASNYVSLVKKAMLKAGFDNVPVISVSTGNSTINHQPGFRKRYFELLSLSLNTLIYTDALLKMYNFLSVREKHSGDAKRVYDKYIGLAYQNRRKYVIKDSVSLLKQAVEEFNHVEYHDYELPRVGIVGEIFAKYNRFGNFNIEEWLRNNKVEVVTSPLNTFFLESLVDIKFNRKNFVEETNILEIAFHSIVEKRVGAYIDKVNSVLDGFNHRLVKLHKIDKIRQYAEKVTSLIHQYGEGWLLPGDIVMFAEEGINNVLSVQPFGCIACHVVSKGISGRIKEMYPEINLLFLDMDADTSEANFHNRLEFFVMNAKKYDTVPDFI